ncbi:MAG: polysaccharide biosynthesis C-terminal domain-containing protein [Clostridium sp.]|nr:polysaccharide biosynthesis C-terminal domain-containing protein [Clostridium sp.]
MNVMRRKAVSPKRDNYTMISQLAFLVVLIFRIPLGYMTGDKGLAYFGLANELFLMTAGTVSYGLSEATAALVRYRIKREQLKSVKKTLRWAMLLGGVIGILFSLLFAFGGRAIAGNVLHLPLAGLSVCIMAPAIFFSILTGVFRGYFQGNGSKVPAVHSQILYTVFLFVGGLAGAGALHGYGKKVSALLQNSDYAASYGAMGASIGLLAASVFCFLHGLVLYTVYRNTSKKQGIREQQRNQDTGFYLLKMLLGGGFFYSLYFFSFQALPLLDQYLYFSSEGTGDMTGSWGIYYGKCLVVIGVVCGIINLFCGISRGKSPLLEREEKRFAREKLGIFIHQCAVIAIPAAVFLAVFAENILNLLFKGSQKQAAVWLQIGSIAVVFCVLGSLFMEILLKNRRVNYAAVVGVIGLVFHMVAAVLLIKVAKLGMIGVITAVILFYAVVTIAGFFLISRLFGYAQEWVKCFVFTIGAAAVSGVAALLLNRLLSSLVGTTISMVVCLVIAIAVYMILLIVTRALKEEELEEMTGGRLYIKLAESIHYM